MEQSGNAMVTRHTLPWLTPQFLFICVLIHFPSALADERPNIVVILTDDQGWGDLSCNGNTNLSTPNIDSLGKDGASFDRFYVCPVCSSTRAEFLTGRYHPRSGVYDTSSGGERINLDELTIGDTFLEAGYATAAFGKWHNGMQYPYHPNGRGFEEFYGYCSGHWGDYFSPPLEHNGQMVQGKGYLADDLTNKTIAFIESNRDRPFFAYLPFNTPHAPMQVPDRWWKKFDDKNLAMHHREPEREEIEHTRCALAMCENIDWNVGRILKKLEELKLVENTIVVFFCDNGPNGYRWNGGMKGHKGSTDEGGVRSPLMIRWPKQIEPGRKILPIAAAIDLLPTLADLAKIKVQSAKPLDGVSLLPRLLGQVSAEKQGRLIFSHWMNRVSVRTQRYRLDSADRLYDMTADPGQYTDIAEKQPLVADRLRKAVQSWRNTVLADSDVDNRPFIIGHPKARFTQLPARDGVAHGNIKRSNQYPNCSFFTNWISTADKITWNAEVGATGDYEVEIYYTCPQADVGSTVELSFNDHSMKARVVSAHNPPQRGDENDRVPRKSSYVKDFKAIKLGTIHLDKGRGELTLRAIDLPGSQVMDFRQLVLARIEAQ